MTNINKLEKRLDAIARKPDEEAVYKEGFRAGQAEWERFYSGLPFLFQQTIDEYLFHSSERTATSAGSSYPNTKEEAMKWFAAAIDKETKVHAQVDGFLKAGKGNTKYRCPNCDVEYFSSLLMAFHQFDKHAILTTQQ